MKSLILRYPQTSSVTSERENNFMRLVTPEGSSVRYSGHIASGAAPFIQALRAFGKVADTNNARLTVQSDALVLECFRKDHAAGATLFINRELFETKGEPSPGTAIIDFSETAKADLRNHVANRLLHFSVDCPKGPTSDSPLPYAASFDRKSEEPDDWVRSWLLLQYSFAQPATTFAIRSVDLLNAIAYWRETKPRDAGRVSVRYEFQTGGTVQMVAEPWEKTFPLPGARHSLEKPQKYRFFDHRLMEMLTDFLPHAHSVDVRILGDRLPIFYVVRVPHVTLVLGLTGWNQKVPSDGSRRRLLNLTHRPLAGVLAQELAQRELSTLGNLAMRLEKPLEETRLAGQELCRSGQALFDLSSSQARLRSRELFPPARVAKLFSPVPRLALAEKIVPKLTKIQTTALSHQMHLSLRVPKWSGHWLAKGRKFRRAAYREWRIEATSQDLETVEIVVNPGHRDAIRHGHCSCKDWKKDILGDGPCQHMIALWQVTEASCRNE